MASKDKEKTKARILEAVGSVIAKSGFRKLGINEIAKEAGVDKVLIYRYFDGLPNLLREFALQTDYWPSMKDFIESLAPEERPQAGIISGKFMYKALVSLLHELQKRPITQEIIKWELIEKNELTEELAKARELTVPKDICPPKQVDLDQKPAVDVAAINALLCGGMLFLLLHSKNKGHFAGVPLQTEADWQRIEEALQTVIEATFKDSKFPAHDPCKT